MKGNQEIAEIDIKRIALSLLPRAWAIILVGVLCAALLFGYAYCFVTPQYTASIKIYVNNTYGMNSPGFSSSQLSAAQSLAKTYMVIMESRTVMNEVAEITGLPYTYKQLVGMTESSTIDETEVFETTVTCANYKHAAQIANAIAQVLPEEIAAVVDGSSVRVVDYAVENSAVVSPNYRNYAVLGMAVGVLLSSAVAILIDLWDNSIRSEEYLEEAYQDMPLLAVIPDAENARASGYYKGYYVAGEKRQLPKKTGGEK